MCIHVRVWYWSSLSAPHPVPIHPLTYLLTYPPNNASHTNLSNSGDAAIRYDHPLFPHGVQVVKVPGAGHFVHQERPEEVNALILGWFRRQEEGVGEGEGR